MALSNIIPREVSINGSLLTGSNGAQNRTYTISDAGLLTTGMDIVIAGSRLQQTIHFTIAGNVITFLDAVDNGDAITIQYFIVIATSSQASIATSTALKYATPLQLAAVIGVKSDVPSWAPGSTPALEVVGTGDDVVTIFYLDQKNVLSDSFTISSGANEAAATELTETTHYAIDKEKGKLTLTAAGVTQVSTDKIFAEYSYINIGMTDAYFQAVLSRAEKQVDSDLNATFTDGTGTNPNYPSATELHPTRGATEREYYSDNRPLIDIDSTLPSGIDDSVSTIPVAIGDGASFPSSGNIVIEDEVMSYTGVSSDNLTGVTRGILGTTAAAHVTAKEIHTTILWLSDTAEGNEPTFKIQSWNSDFVAKDNGKFFIYETAIVSDLWCVRFLLDNVENRVKMFYFYGFDFVPQDITRLTLIFAKRMLMQDTVSVSMIKGRDEFNPEVFNVDQSEIDRIVDAYRQNAMGNT